MTSVSRQDAYAELEQDQTIYLFHVEGDANDLTQVESITGKHHDWGWITWSGREGLTEGVTEVFAYLSLPKADQEELFASILELGSVLSPQGTIHSVRDKHTQRNMLRVSQQIFDRVVYDYMQHIPTACEDLDVCVDT